MPRLISIVCVYKLPASIYVSAGCLSKSYKIGIDGLSGMAMTPTLQWTSDDRPRIVSPALEPKLQKHIDHYATGTKEGWDQWLYWGEVNKWNPKEHAIFGAYVGAIMLMFKVNPKDITYSDYLHGRGHPEGKDVQLLFENIDEWFERLRTWVEVARDQDVDPYNPIPSSTVRAAGLQVLTVEESTISIPKNAFHIMTGLNTDEYINLPALRKAFGMASSGVLPSDAHVLLRDSRAAFRRGYFRRAVIDAGSATELCLADLNNRFTPPPIPTSRKTTLGQYVANNTIKAKASLPSNTMADLVNVRNDAIHQNKTPTRQEAKLALRLAKQIVCNIDPLPF